MSTWRCKVDDEEIGPVSLQELAALLREGQISERMLVRRDGSDSWEPAWNVVGLMEAARREPAAAGSGDPAATAADGPAATAGDGPAATTSGGPAATAGHGPAATQSPRLPPSPIHDAPGHRLGSQPATGPTTVAGAGILTNSATRGALAGFAALAVTGLLYRWAYWKTMAFPPPRRGGVVVYWFPLFGECNAVEYALLYVDLFVVAAAVAWWLCGPLARRMR